MRVANQKCLGSAELRLCVVIGLELNWISALGPRFSVLGIRFDLTYAVANAGCISEIA